MDKILPADLIEKQLKYYNNHDIEGFVSTYSESIRLYNQGECEPFLVGLDSLRRRYLDRFSNPKLHADITNRMVLGDYVVDFENVTGIDENAVTRVVVIYEVKYNLIQNVWFVRG